MDRKTYFADILLPLAVHNLFTYRIPFELNNKVAEGFRVVVPFGKSKYQTGIIVRIHEQIPEKYEPKYIEYVLDEFPIIAEQQYQFWEWLSKYYMAPLGDVMNASLPSNLKLASETKVKIHPDFKGDLSLLNEKAKQVVSFLEIAEQNKGFLDLKELGDLLEVKNPMPYIKTLIDRQIVDTFEDLEEKYKVKTMKFVRLNPEFREESFLNEVLESFTLKKKDETAYHTLLILIKAGGWDEGEIHWVPKKTLEKNGASSSSIETLAKKGFLEIEDQAVDRIHFSNKKIIPIKPLSEAQKIAYTEIETFFEEKNTVLLEGVTGSGKTEIYVHYIQKVIDEGKQVLFLLPEIALTTQLIARLQNYFGPLVGIYHSKFNQNERVEVWYELLKKEQSKYKIIIGARSSIFLPFFNLGLVIIDEEHETSFKQQDPSPRYHGKDAALVLAHIHQAKTILGSATPSIESKKSAEDGKFGMVYLKERFGNSVMPQIEIIDMFRERTVNKNFSFFSNQMIREIEDAIINKEQVILFQNRRGYTPQQSCEVCSWTPSCTNCDVKLTYHMQGNIMKCHYCGFATAPVSSCNSCGSSRIKTVGMGTEKVEDELKIHFPTARVARMDLDSTRGKNAFSILLDQFDNHEIDVLVGTQMLTKGLDFERVSLVGIIDADHLLNIPDFRAHERAYQLMTQVSGRAGRRGKQGRVLLQTSKPENWVVKCVVESDYQMIYEAESKERAKFHYPPYSKLIKITLKHREENPLKEYAHELAQLLFDIFKDRVIGPDIPSISRIKNRYLREIQIKMEPSISQVKSKEKIQEAINQFLTIPRHRSCIISIDVDPY